MKSRFMLFMMSFACGLACWAQTTSGTGGSTTQAAGAQNAPSVCRIFFVKPKLGAEAQLEQGRKKHMQFHKSQNDTWTWNTYVIETGMNAGTYVTSTCGHAWKDFDDWEKRLGKADAADASASMAAYEQSSSNSFMLVRNDMGLAPANAPTAPKVAVTVYSLRPGTAPEFIDAIKKINDALRKQADWPKTSTWLQLANGGDSPEFVLLNSRQGWADFATPPKTVQDVVSEAYGKDGGDAIFKTIRDLTAHLYTEAATYRPDLSYIPGK